MGGSMAKPHFVVSHQAEQYARPARFFVQEGR